MSLLCPVLDLHKNNLFSSWPALLLAIKSSNFVAVDLELSGLGNRKNLASKCLNERYNEISSAAKSRSIISLGLACFKAVDQVESSCKYIVQTFNLLALCSQPYVVEPQALIFLTEHGFDFNKQYLLGLPYKKGNGETDDQPYKKPCLRLLFRELVQARKPIVLHNGLIDLAFLYQNLYLDLPAKLSTFLADIEDLFSAGVYDTKYIAEYHIRSKASYLQHVFQSCLKWNNSKSNPISYSFMSLPESRDLALVELSQTGVSFDAICQQYACHGWCPKGLNCPNAHKVDLTNAKPSAASRPSKSTLKKKRRKEARKAQKRARIELLETSTDLTDCLTETDNQNDTNDGESNETATHTSTVVACELNSDSNEVNMFAKQNCHRAGIDAFMTGVSFTCFTAQLQAKGIETVKVMNALYLSGKDIPLLVTKGNFGKVSLNHKHHTFHQQTQSSF